MTKPQSIGKVQRELITAHYQRANEAKAEGKPVVYVTAMFPVEIVKAFEPHLATVYPENHAALLISRGLAEDLASKATVGAHLDKMGCAYELVNTGYLLQPESALVDAKGRPISKLPEPDVLLACDNQCRVVSEWFANLGKLFDATAYSVNVGDNYTGEESSRKTTYIRGQLEHVIAFLEEKTGTDLNQDKLLEVARQSNSAVKLWREYLELGKLTPSPVTSFDGFFHMAPIVSERGTQQAVDYYQQLLNETDVNEGAVQPEKHRLLWDNLATWFNFGELKRYFSDRNIAVVGSTYLDVWKKELDTTSYDTLLDSMAEAYGTMYTNQTMDQRIDLWKEMVRSHRAEGILFHDNRSCHTFSLRQREIAKALKEEFGNQFRTIHFEGDQGLKERFQETSLKTKVETYFCD
ncbi:2-hydroxyacyl-CoA dehydratase [Candidatus Woesearchaeota archaeon]|mgnify:FL=1|jgi:benzoyl-CoA reductase/2-hydroxyglutaryl-CoA dehydratase subunit BcrC/BadD/HgdB|nr:2-hydroxyacyl-CoA dehydratase [Candidatus Woesearchaeota archaeon]MBT4111344.1 2-hydroxyacyl-CoA dehydratase [Candidatus Woesearchaeota archaeon]MBT4469890.1 2-hydroxyacyl-CoA dehydratase [Candidatus Woesearchaeota archaeon]MBT6744439.1 2-hydroxyacyl-CoA dehydratase [Candidatus Woesearchaeota archaeon]